VKQKLQFMEQKTAVMGTKTAIFHQKINKKRSFLSVFSLKIAFFSPKSGLFRF